MARPRNLTLCSFCGKFERQRNKPITKCQCNIATKLCPHSLIAAALLITITDIIMYQ